MKIPNILKAMNNKENYNNYIEPLISNTFIDKACFTGDYPEEQHDVIIKKLIKYQHHAAKAFYVKPYKHGVMLSSNMPDYNGVAFLLCKPASNVKKAKYNFVKVETTPSRNDMDYIKTALDDILPDGYLSFIKKAKVTQLHVTVDISRVRVDELITKYPKMTAGYKYENTTGTESKYIGSSKSKKQILLYDKVAELEKMKEKYPGITVPIEDTVRLEMQLSPINTTLTQVPALPNPFKPLSITAFPGSMSNLPLFKYDPLWRLFLICCKDHGLEYALSHFRGPDKEKIMARFNEEGKTDWYNPDAIWAGLNAAIEAVLSVKGYTPQVQPIAWSDHQQIQ